MAREVDAESFIGQLWKNRDQVNYPARVIRIQDATYDHDDVLQLTGEVMQSFKSPSTIGNTTHLKLSTLLDSYVRVG